MGHIGKLSERRNQARCSTRNGWECSKIFTRRTVADDQITELEANKLDESYVEHKNKITIADERIRRRLVLATENARDIDSALTLRQLGPRGDQSTTTTCRPYRPSL